MKALRTLLALSSADRRLFGEALLTVLIARGALWTADIAWLRRWAAGAGRPGGRSTSRSTGRSTGRSIGRPVGRIVWATQAACRRVPGATCLVSSLALQRMLSRHGHASELHIGVARKDTVFTAHAWVVCDGDVHDGVGSDEPYTRLVAWRASDAA